MNTHRDSRIRIITLLALVSLLMTGCQDEPFGPDEKKPTDTTTVTPPPVPAITSFSPESAPADSVITITGKGFETDKEKDSLIVRFGAVNAQIVSADDTLIRAIVPPHAPSEPITMMRGLRTATSAKSFQPIRTYRASVKITGVVGVMLDSVSMQYNLTVDTTEKEHKFETWSRYLIYHGPAGIDTLRSTRSIIVLNTITRRIISAVWSQHNSYTDKGGPGHMDDQSFSNSLKWTLRDMPYMATTGGMISTIPATELSKEMIDYDGYEFRSGTMWTPRIERRHILIGLGQPLAGGEVSLTIEMQ